jgi:VanZ family protein
MSNSVQRARSWVVAWWPVVFMTAVIALESTERFGANHTSGPLRYVYQALFGNVSDARWEVIHHYVRKCGHFTGYGLVCLSWLRASWKTLPNRSFMNSAVLAMIATAITASVDEFHQSFLPNRTSSVWDVLIDCSGAFALLVLAGTISLIRRTYPDASAA